MSHRERQPRWVLGAASDPLPTALPRSLRHFPPPPCGSEPAQPARWRTRRQGLRRGSLLVARRQPPTSSPPPPPRRPIGAAFRPASDRPTSLPPPSPAAILRLQAGPSSVVAHATPGPLQGRSTEALCSWPVAAIIASRSRLPRWPPSVPPSDPLPTALPRSPRHLPAAILRLRAGPSCVVAPAPPGPPPTMRLLQVSTADIFVYIPLLGSWTFRGFQIEASRRHLKRFKRLFVETPAASGRCAGRLKSGALRARCVITRLRYPKDVFDLRSR